MTCPALEHIPVIYLTTVAVTAFDLTARSRGYSSIYSIDTIINVAQVVFVTFSLIINCSTTFIIALKAWCVPIYGVFRNLDCALIRCARTSREYRKWLMESGIGIQTPRQAIGMLSVLVESGAIYILISVSSFLVSTHGLLIFFLFRSQSWPLLSFSWLSESKTLVPCSCLWPFSS